MSFGLLVISGCSKDAEIQLKLGQTLVEIMDDEFFYFEEFLRVENHSYNGKTLDQYILKYYHNSYDAFMKSTWTDYLDDDDEKNNNYEAFKELTVVDVNRYNIKDTSTYIKVPGSIKLLFALDDPIDYELINDSMIKINDWRGETSISVAYTEGDYKKLKKPKDNYVLFDFTTIDKLIYKEIIAVKMEDYSNSNSNIITPFSEWIINKGYDSVEDLQQDIPFRWAFNNDKVKNDEFKKYDDALVLSFGNIKTDTYIRVPREILFISDDVDYKYIDEETILIKEGVVTIVYKD